jgi:hypothetical protein
MFLNWFDGRSATQLGNEVAADIRHLLPLEADAKQKNPVKRQQKLMRIVERTCAKGAQHRFNLYQKAKFANTLRWSLKDHGYSPDFTEEVVALILARI